MGINTQAGRCHRSLRVKRSMLFVGLALCGSATAAGLGPAQLSSHLGEPLRMQVPLTLAQGESTQPGCIQIVPGIGMSPALVQSLRISVPAVMGPTTSLVQISTRTPVREPVIGMTLNTGCSGMAQLTREFLLLIDPVATTSPVMQATAASDSQRGAPRPVPARENPPAVTNTADPLRSFRTGEKIPTGSRYRVRRGDTLSTIAYRIQGRPANTTARVSRWILRTNPGAFIDGDPDRIMLGALIRIPSVSDMTATPSARPAPPKPAVSGATAAPAASRRARPVRPAAGAVDAPASIAPVTVQGQQRAQPASLQESARPAKSATAETLSTVSSRPESNQPSLLLQAGAGLIFGLLLAWFMLGRGWAHLSAMAASGFARRGEQAADQRRMAVSNKSADHADTQAGHDAEYDDEGLSALFEEPIVAEEIPQRSHSTVVEDQKRNADTMGLNKLSRKVEQDPDLNPTLATMMEDLEATYVGGLDATQIAKPEFGETQDSTHVEFGPDDSSGDDEDKTTVMPDMDDDDGTSSAHG